MVGCRRTLAPLPHGRKLVHVASLPARRVCRNQQNPPRQSKSNEGPQAHRHPHKTSQAQVTQHVNMSAIFSLQYPRESSMLLSLKTAPCNGGSSFLSLPRFCFYPISGPVQGTLPPQSPRLHHFGAL